MSSLFCKKIFFIFYLTKCEKPSGKFSLGLAHIVELCRQFLLLLLGSLEPCRGLLSWCLHYSANPNSVAFLSFVFTTDKICQFQEIVNFFTNSTFLSKNCACEIFHKSAPAGAGLKCQVFFAKKIFYFLLDKCRKA